MILIYLQAVLTWDWIDEIHQKSETILAESINIKFSDLSWAIYWQGRLFIPILIR